MISIFRKFFKELFRVPQGRPYKVVNRDLIKKWEGLRLRAYRDTGDVWTIGYGHTAGVLPNDRITKDEAEMFLSQDLLWVEDVINSTVKVPLTQKQYDALGSFIYNVGGTAFANSTMLKKLNNKDYEGASKEFLRWIYDNGRVIQGLRNRRKDEMRYFLS